MSTEEAAEYIASGRTNPPQDYAPITEGQPAAGWREALEAALVDDEQDELPFDVSQTLRTQDADEQDVAQDQPGEPPVGLRSDADIDEDLDRLVGPYALSHTPEQRHLATLRLIDDLVGARQTLRQLVGA